MSKYKIVESEDWQELYKDGEKIAESHYLTVGEVLTALGLEFEYRWRSNDD